MPRRAADADLALPPREPTLPPSRWLCDALRGEIVDGRLAPGTRLPSTRDLARQYGIARGTVVGAYEQLRAEGYLEGAVGSGTYVSRVRPDALFTARRVPAPPGRSAPPLRRLSPFGRVAPLLPPYADRRTRAFRPNLPALEHFPTALWARVEARIARQATARQLRGARVLGYPPLQEAIAEYLRTSRGVKCAAAQVAVVSGVQEAISLATRVLVAPGDRVCIEDPGYVGAAYAFVASGARVVPVPVDGNGMTVPPARLGDVRLAYVTPAHQYPLGVSMSVGRRFELLAWARARGAMILEDDYDSEFRYVGRPLPALQGLDQDGVVLLAGTLSKVLFPALRIAYLVVPEDLVDAFTRAKSITTGHGPLLAQAAVADFISEGHFGRHLRRMRQLYAERRAVLLDEVRLRLNGRMEITGLDAGLQTAAFLLEVSDDEALSAEAAARDVDAVPLSRFYRRRGAARAGIQLGFAAIDDVEIRRGVRGLEAAFDALGRRTRR